MHLKHTLRGSNKQGITDNVRLQIFTLTRETAAATAERTKIAASVGN